VRACVRACVRRSVCLPACLPVCQSVCLSVCLSVWAGGCGQARVQVQVHNSARGWCASAAPRACHAALRRAGAREHLVSAVVPAQGAPAARAGARASSRAPPQPGRPQRPTARARDKELGPRRPRAPPCARRGHHPSCNHLPRTTVHARGAQGNPKRAGAGWARNSKEKRIAVDPPPPPLLSSDDHRNAKRPAATPRPTPRRTRAQRHPAARLKDHLHQERPRSSGRTQPAGCGSHPRGAKPRRAPAQRQRTRARARARAPCLRLRRRLALRFRLRLRLWNRLSRTSARRWVAAGACRGRNAEPRRLRAAAFATALRRASSEMRTSLGSVASLFLARLTLRFSSLMSCGAQRRATRDAANGPADRHKESWRFFRSHRYSKEITGIQKETLISIRTP